MFIFVRAFGKHFSYLLSINSIFFLFFFSSSSSSLKVTLSIHNANGKRLHLRSIEEEKEKKNIYTTTTPFCRLFTHPLHIVHIFIYRFCSFDIAAQFSLFLWHRLISNKHYFCWTIQATSINCQTIYGTLRSTLYGSFDPILMTNINYIPISIIRIHLIDKRK